MNKIPHVRQFSNGLSLILQTMPSAQSVTIYVAVGAGSRYETRETAGTAHFLEHMLFEGTEDLPSSRKLAEYIERVGGRSSAWTDKEYVIYYVKVPKTHLDVAFSYLGQILFNPTLASEAVKKEKRIIFEEIKGKEDNPAAEIWDLWLEWVCGENQTLGHPTLGDKTTVLQVTARQLQYYLKKFYHPANMAIAVVGNFSPKEAEYHTFKYFGKKQKRKIPTFKELSRRSSKIHTKIIKKNTQQAQLILGFLTNISNTHKERFTLEVITSVLSGGVSSRLFHKLIYELGIAYSSGAQSLFFSDVGLFYTYGGFSIANMEIAIKIIVEELKKLKEEKISERELQAAKEQRKANIIFSSETPDAKAYLYSVQQITERKIMTIEEVLKNTDQVNAEDIQRVSRQYLTNENLYLTIRGSAEENSLERIESILKL